MVGSPKPFPWLFELCILHGGIGDKVNEREREREAHTQSKRAKGEGTTDRGKTGQMLPFHITSIPTIQPTGLQVPLTPSWWLEHAVLSPVLGMSEV